MRPYHLLQLAALVIGAFLLLRPATAPDAVRWTQSAGGWLSALLVLAFGLFAIAAGAVGLRMRCVTDLGLGLAAVGVAIAVLLRFLILPLR
jgi:hypothetical protein